MTERERKALAQAISVAKAASSRVHVLEKRCEALRQENDGLRAQLRAIYKLSRSGYSFDPSKHGGIRYETEEERVEAKRRSWRESKRRSAAEKRVAKAAA